jgi:hypothetical protein
MSAFTDHLDTVGIPYCKRCEDMYHLNEDGTTKCPKAFKDCDRHTAKKEAVKAEAVAETVEKKVDVIAQPKPAAKKKPATPAA